MLHRTILRFTQTLRSLLGRYRLTTRVFGRLAMLLLISGAVLHPAAATDFGGDQTGNTLTAPDNDFTFLVDFKGLNIIVKSTMSGTVLDFSLAPSAVWVNLSNDSTYQTVYAGLTVLFQGFNTAGNIDFLIGGNGNDFLIGGDGDDRLYGDTGNDIINGGAGNDIINGGTGDDTLNGDTGNDIINGQAGNDNLYGGDGNDTLNGNMGNDNLYGQAGNDNLYGGAGNDTRSDTNGADCASDTLNSDVETDNCVVVPPPPPPAPAASHSLTPELCITGGTRMAYQADRNIIVVYSDFEDSNRNGMIITEIPLGAIPAPSDEQKASGQPIGLLYKDSEFAPGWSLGLYWQNSHYGVQVFKDGNMFDDTGAICGWF